MDKADRVIEELSKIGIVPVIALEDAADAEPLAKALISGGLPCAEVTFRTEAAEDAIRIITEKFPEMHVGAGTVLDAIQAKRAVDAGAKFIVSPGLNPKVVSWCAERNIPVLPGCATPSDIESAIRLGLSAVKFFPAEASGGLLAIQAMAAPYPKLRFMPTGGITAKNLKSYLDFKKVIACGGSFMVNPTMLKEKDWKGITALTKAAVSSMLGYTLKHIEINSGQKCTGSFFVLAELGIEFLKKHGRGTHGSITVGVNYMERAVYHLGRHGIRFEESGKEYHADGSLKSVCFADEIGGFDVHLVQNKQED